MKEGSIYIDEYGEKWTLKWWYVRHAKKEWYVWNEITGYGLWMGGKGLTLYSN